MTKVLTIRLSPDLLSRAEAKAARLGLDRTNYVRSLIEEDLTSKTERSKHKFASEDLLGSIALGQGPYTNRRVKEIIRAKNGAKREKNR